MLPIDCTKVHPVSMGSFVGSCIEEFHPHGIGGEQPAVSQAIGCPDCLGRALVKRIGECDPVGGVYEDTFHSLSYT